MKQVLQSACTVGLVCWSATVMALTLPQHPVANKKGEFIETSELPSPHVTPRITKNLSLKESILLALRNNPDVISDELTRVTDKFALEAAYYSFEPQYTLGATNTMDRGAKPTYSVQPGVSLTTPLGTQFTTTYENTLAGGRGNYAFGVAQPLLKDFGTAYNLVSLRDSIDSEKIAKWTFKSSMISAVDTVVTSYRSLVEDYNSLRVQKQSVKESEKTVEQYKLEVKAGKVAPSDLLQQQANLASNRVSLLETESSLATAYQSFLSALGLSSDSKIKINKKIAFKRYQLPTLKEAIQVALKNNPTYRSELLNLEVSKRAIISAKNDSRWTLNVTATETTNQTGGSSGSTSDDSSVGFELEIPIDDVSAKQELVDAKIALEQAKLSMEQEKEELIRTVTSEYSNIKMGYQEVLVSRTSVSLEKKTVENEKIKLKYGKSTVFEVNTLSDSLLSEQLSLIDTEISYMNDVTTFEATLGTTLEHWKINLRY